MDGKLQESADTKSSTGGKNCLSHEPCPPKFPLESELGFCFTDFNDDNFMFRTQSRHDGRLQLYVADFEHASFLPLSVLAYANIHGDPRFPVRAWLAANIGIDLPSENLEVMQRILYSFQSSARTLGLSHSQREPARSRA